MIKGRWLTAKRLRAQGLLLALTIWSLYIWTIATPGLRDRNGNLKGTDFLHLYTLGCLAREHRGTELYHIKSQAAVLASQVPDAAGVRYLPLYPPQVSILFAPLSYLRYEQALGLWWALNTILYGTCCFLVWRICPNLRVHGGTVALLAVAFPAFFNLIAWGQTSAIALTCFTVAFFCLRKKQNFLAGLALGCLIYKPQLGLAAAMVFLSLGSWKIVGGAILAAAAQLYIGLRYYGLQSLLSWMQTLRNVRSVLPLLEPRPYQTHCLRTFWSMIIPQPAIAIGLYGVSALVVLAWTILTWKRTLPLSVRYSALLLATVLVAPHLTVYDLVILAPAFLLLSDWLTGALSGPAAGRIAVALYLAFLLPLLASVTRWTHVQLSVPVMMALIYWIWRDGNLSADAVHSA